MNAAGTPPGRIPQESLTLGGGPDGLSTGTCSAHISAAAATTGADAGGGRRAIRPAIGLLDTIGRAANAGLAALPGFTLPGDISASTRFYAQDIVTDPITITDGHVAVPTGVGLGFDIDHAFLDSVTTSTTLLRPDGT